MTFRLLAATLLILAANANAAPPAAWNNRTCSSCHLSADIQTWPTNFLSGLSANNLKERLVAQTVNGAAMPDLANDNTDTGHADRVSILKYLLDVRDGGISTNNLAFDSVTIDALLGSTRTVTITNERSRAMSYSVPVISPSNNGFSVISDSCLPSRSVSAGGTCTLTVRFLPASPPADTALRSATLNFTLSGTGGDPNPGIKSVALSGIATTPLEITAGPLSFTADPSTVSPAQMVTITNRLNSNLRLCLSGTGASKFDLVGQTVEANCTTLSAPASSFNQPLTFSPGAGEPLPRFARLTVQQVTSGGTPLEPERFIDLEGNAGPFVTVTTNALFSGLRQDVAAGPAAPPQVVTLSNAGSSSLRFSSLSVSGAASAEYSPTGCTAGTTLSVGAICDLSVTFDPSETGLRTAQLNIQYTDVDSTPGSQRDRVIALRGEGTRGAVLLVQDDGGAEIATGSNQAFGDQNVGITYKRRIVLSNIGTDEALELAAPLFVPGSTAFTLSPGVSNACTSLTTGHTLAAGASCEAEVRFSPTAVGSYGTSVTLASRPAGAVAAPINFVLNLSGSGVDGRPVLAWQSDAGASISLLEVPGITAVGSTTPPQVSLRLYNPGPGAAALQLLNIVGNDGSSFVVESPAAGGCEFGNAASPLLDEETYCTVVISFRPQTAGAKSGHLQLVSTGTTPAPLEIRAQASGPAVGVALSATPASMHLNEVRVGAQSLPAMVTLSNDSAVPMVVTAISVSPGFSLAPGSCGALPLSILPNSSCTLNVRFEPGSVGETSGILRLQVSGLAEPVDVALRGTGTPAADVSGGGCSISRGQSLFDPTLWSLVMLAAAVLYRRRCRSAAAAQESRTRT